MEEAREMTDILTALKRLDDLENSLSKSYQRLAGLFEKDRAARAFFLRMSSEEKAHSEHVRNQIKVVRSSPQEFKPVAADLSTVDRTLEKISAFDASEPALADAIRFALGIENAVCECYAMTLMAQSNREFSEFLNKITGRMQEEHVQALAAFAAERGVSPRE